MSAPPFMPLYAADYLADTTHLTQAEHGAYLLLLLAMWRNGGWLPADDAHLARFSRSPGAQWSRIKGTILAFFDIENGRLTQRRLSCELAKCGVATRQRSEAGKKSAEAKSLKRQRAEPTDVEISFNENSTIQSQSQSQSQKDKESPSPSETTTRAHARPLDKPRIAFDAYNDVAKELGLPIAASLTEARRKALRKRLEEHGLEGWMRALDGLRAPFCRGENDRGWKASFDSLLQAKTCAKLVENAYDTGPPVPVVTEAMRASAQTEWAARRAVELIDGQQPSLGNGQRDQGSLFALSPPKAGS